MRKIDIFPHIFPRSYYDKMLQIIPNKDAIRRWTNIPILWDLDARLRMMEQWPEYQQILTLSMPPIEYVAPPDKSLDLAKLANDGMAEIVAKHPKKFPAFVASVPMNNIDATLKEIRRTVETMDARGIQIFTNINGVPLDDPEFAPVFEAMASYDLPVWMHPVRPQSFADYPKVEKGSRYDIWWVFGWPYETSAAMARMVFAGFFDRWPNLKIITHHLGAMVPFLEERVGMGLDQLGAREAAEPHYRQIVEDMKKKGRRPLDYFRMFYADTAINGARAGTRCGIDFFGCEHVAFGTDCPFDPEGGPMFIREIMKTLDTLELTADERAKIYNGNARRLLRLD